MSRKIDFRSGRRVSQAISNGQSQNNGDSEENMWSSMLDSVASGRKLPEKNLIVLGGSPETQKEFLDTLAPENTTKRPSDRYKKKPPTANAFALGYTYQDVLDADHEDLLARLSIYLLSEPSAAFAPLVKPLLTARSIPESLLVVLLDWSEPWHWVRQLRNWIRFMKGVTSDLDNEAQDCMETTMREWQQGKRGRAAYDTSGTNVAGDSNVNLPLDPGEWDDSLGLPLCVVCHGADKIDVLEKNRGWHEEDFDFVLQYLRTILMKRMFADKRARIWSLIISDGASLIYTSISVPNSLPILIHSSLGIHSLLKKTNLKHNVIDRDKILIPPSWDSWAKIRVLRDGFDVEGISKGWGVDIETPLPVATAENSKASDGTTNGESNNQEPKVKSRIAEGSILPIYEETIRDPQKDRMPQGSPSANDGLEVECESTQAFLASQQERIEDIKRDEEEAAARHRDKSNKRPATTGDTYTSSNDPSRQILSEDSRVHEHIGPVQFNVGGIQVDAEDMVQRIKSRERNPARTAGGEKGSPKESHTPTTSTSTPQKQQDAKAQNEALANFFAGLMKKERTGSPRGERNN
ncbi:MAG: hypothetical protein Q9191_004744 [Dirinaria sp. TL-2023a]